MNPEEKLRVILPHWIEHNEEHSEEMRRWVVEAGPAAADVSRAIESMTDANRALAAALQKLGGAAPHPRRRH